MSQDRPYSKFRAPFTHWAIAGSMDAAENDKYELAAQGLEKYDKQIQKTKRAFAEEVANHTEGATYIGRPHGEQYEEEED